jgi:endonuclease/exonuclease/phosphatase family metal-dependent hydrolase
MKRAALIALVGIILSLSPVDLFAAPYTILTYNLGLLRVFGFDLVPLVDARIKSAPQVLAAFAAAAKPQIMLLEETWEDAAADAIANELAPLGYAATKPNVHGILGLNSGLLLLVKAPLHVVDWKFTPFSRNTFTDSLARKGVLEATLEDSDTGVRFVLVGTHTVAVDTTNGVPKDKNQIDVITAQAAQILAALASRSQNGALPALLLGDFNVGPGYADAIYRIIADTTGIREAGASLLPDSPLVTWDRENPLVKYGHYPEEPSAKIDHVFLQNGANARWEVSAVNVVQKDPVPGLRITASAKVGQIPTPLSDHYGFLVQIELQ